MICWIEIIHKNDEPSFEWPDWTLPEAYNPFKSLLLIGIRPIVQSLSP